MLLIVADSGDHYIPHLVGQLGISLRYSKLAAKTFDLSSAESLPRLCRYTSVLFLSDPPGELLAESLSDLLCYVQRGGSLTFLAPTMSADTQKLLGVVAAVPYGPPPTDVGQPGRETCPIHFVGNRFEGLQDTTVWFYDVSNRLELKLTLSADASVDAYFEDFDTRQPAIWHRAVGAGEIGVWTFVPTGRHWGRSFLLHAAIQGQPVAVKSVVNTAVFQIDDFPAPAADTPVPVETGVSLPWPAFMDQAWLPDMAMLAEKYRLKYSSGVVFHYNERTQAPFEFDQGAPRFGYHDEADSGAAASHVRWAREYGELGLHGYNHVPLALGDWSSRAHMVEALRACIGWWKRDPNADLPSSYIPPMNVYDQDGALALSEACPSIGTLCGSFWGSVDKGCGREFGFEKWNNKLFCLPRVTSEYVMDENFKWAMLASIYELGVWTHFIHPDDILDVPSDIRVAEYARNPQSRPWRGSNGLRTELERMLDFVQASFPSLSFDTASDAAAKIGEHLSNDFRCCFVAGQIVLDSEYRCQVLVSAREPGREISSIDNAAELLNAHTMSDRTNYTIRLLPGRTTVRFSN